MDARALLESVSEAYRNLNSLEAQAIAITESRDDGFSRSEQPVTFSYVAPNQVRLEQGRSGMLFVSDGQALHIFFAGPKRYSKAPLPRPHPLPGVFNPQFPYVSNNSTFLFPNVVERVTAAEILRRESLALEGAEAACDVVSVTLSHPSTPVPSLTRLLSFFGWIRKPG